METPDPLRVLAPGRADLEALRSDPALWSEVSYAEAPGPDGEAVDRNAPRRAAVLWAAQYDRRHEDLELLRHLLDQEILHHRLAAGQGISEELRLAVHLVARWLDPADLTRLYEARMANFDTFCGLSGIPSQEVPGPGTEPVWDAEAVAAWVSGVGDVEFPDDPGEEIELEWARRARLQGMRGQARAFFAEPLERESPDAGLLRHISYELALMGDYAEAARVQRMYLERDRDPLFGGGSALCRLSELELRAGHPEEAWRVLRQCVAVLEEDDATNPDGYTWRGVGMGLHVVEQHMRIALATAASARELAREVLTAGAALLEELDRLSPLLLSLTREAAQRLDDAALLQRCAALAETMEGMRDGPAS